MGQHWNTLQPLETEKNNLNIGQLVQNLQAQGALGFHHSEDDYGEDGEDDDGGGDDVDDDGEDGGGDGGDGTCPAIMSVSL